MTGLFDILGPTMVGPSSSHTAGACRLGLITRAIAGGTPDHALIELHGSFAMTGEGHGTKRALIGGLLGFEPDDPGLRESLKLADDHGLAYEFRTRDLGDTAHPNTARLTVQREGRETELRGCSIGGGRVEIQEIDGIRVSLSGAHPTLVVLADDVPGTIAQIAGLFAERGLNLATMLVDRTGRGEQALMTIELDDAIPDEVIDALSGKPWTHWIRTVQQLDRADSSDPTTVEGDG